MIDTIKDIRSRLRRAMNGVASTSMREKGIGYKLNFGVSLPAIKEIALSYTKDEALAEALWKEDVRELKILATLLYPSDRLTYEQAEKWVADIHYQEIAEQFCGNLLQELSFAEDLASAWIAREEEYVQVSGFLLYARLCSKGILLKTADRLFTYAKKVMDEGVSRKQRAAGIALKRYGRQDGNQARAVLKLLEEYGASDSLEKQEFFNDIKFEFDYYL